jgi:nitrate reductase gamma subunit
MTLDHAIHLVAYAALLAFVLAVVVRFLRISRLPLHLRWELYPVAHEKGRAQYGGSYFEEMDWWTKPRQSSLLGELGVMVPEILLLAGVRHHNRSQWYRSFPFHFGLYLIILTTVLLLAEGLALAAGATVGPTLALVTSIAGYAGLGLGLAGSLALLGRRLLNEDYREYTNPVEYANLLFFVVTFALALVAHATGDPGFARTRGFFGGLVTFGAYAPAAGLTPLLAVTAVLMGLLLAYVPLTHMSHFFTKWFMYHGVRWSDEPLRVGGKIERQVMESLKLRPTWSAPHIQGDGKKTWVDIATTSGLPESEKKGEKA